MVKYILENDDKDTENIVKVTLAMCGDEIDVQINGKGVLWLRTDGTFGRHYRSDVIEGIQMDKQGRIVLVEA